MAAAPDVAVLLDVSRLSFKEKDLVVDAFKNCRRKVRRGALRFRL